ncbi:unnamed protein product [Mytilus coruscus]|uniref:C-type lectin domain-containing protein n=1 Tax=Mytilus coruscus TaxID=42192 RepID=A0A6J8CBD4_MYTCO|nr:unnamed protein product [Mytilus coruscus]
MQSLLAIFLVVAAASVDAACPRDWTELEGSCWFVSHEKAKWTDASSACQSFHGELVSACQSFHGELAVLPDRQILTSVTDGLLRHTHGDKFWLDGSDIITEGDWLWNSNLQPIDLQMLGVSISDNEKDKNCLYIDRDNHNRWKAESCESDAYYICQHRYMSIKIIKSFIKCMQKRKLL